MENIKIDAGVLGSGPLAGRVFAATVEAWLDRKGSPGTDVALCLDPNPFPDSHGSTYVFRADTGLLAEGGVETDLLRVDPEMVSCWNQVM